MKFLTKVVPISKSIKSSLENCKSWASGINQGYLYVSYFDPEFNAYACAATATNGYVDLFLESDLILYEEPKSKESGKGMFVELKTGTDTSRIFNLTNVCYVGEHNTAWCRMYMKNNDAGIMLRHSYETIKQLLTDKGLML